MELIGRGDIVSVGRDYDAWDLHLVSGRLGAARLLVAFEDNGSGNQYLRFRAWPHASKPACLSAFICLVIAGMGGIAGSLVITAVFGIVGLLIATAVAGQCSLSLDRLWSVLPSASVQAR